MEAPRRELPPPPPGPIGALVSGFNAVANDVGIILFPALFDLFLWIGPRLKLDALLLPLVQDMTQMTAGQPAGQTLDAQSLLSLTTFIKSLNFFSSLRTFPIGVFSLMSVNTSDLSPLGARIDIEIGNWANAFFLVIGFTVLGWLLGSLYFHGVAKVALKTKSYSEPSLWHSVLHGMLLSGSWTILLWIISLPVTFFLVILQLISPTIALIIMLFLLLVFIWLAIPVFFSAHGIFANSNNAFFSIWRILWMVRYSMPALGWFSLVAVLISQGLDMLWRVPPTDSWMMLVGIFGHAFISTGLLAASFIYYHDLSSWIESALQWLKTQTTSARA